jgi:hypothetical protein
MTAIDIVFVIGIFVAVITVMLLAIWILGKGIDFIFRETKQHKRGDDVTLKQVAAAHGIPIQDFTCYDCPLYRTCDLAFDPYNTNGDCLAEK